jgi:single-stranded DNA-binding protein
MIPSHRHDVKTAVGVYSQYSLRGVGASGSSAAASTARSRTGPWEAEDGAKRTAVEIEAEEVAASLRWATAKLTKATKAGAQDWIPDGEPAEEAPAQ